MGTSFGSNGKSATPLSRNNFEDNDFVFESYTQRIIIASVLCLVTIVGMLGNGLVILGVLLSRKLRSTTNWFIVNLGVADFITCMFSPFNIVAMLSTVEDGWPIADWTCAMTGAVTLTCVGASIITLALIALNRWILLTKPKQRYYGVYTKCNVSIMVSFSWLYPFLLVMVPHFAGLGELGYSYNYKVCQQDTTLPTSNYYSLIAGAGVIIPVFIFIVTIYVFIYRFIARHNKGIKRNLETSGQNTSGDIATSLDTSSGGMYTCDLEEGRNYIDKMSASACKSNADVVPTISQSVSTHGRSDPLSQGHPTRSDVETAEKVSSPVHNRKACVMQIHSQSVESSQDKSDPGKYEDSKLADGDAEFQRTETKSSTPTCHTEVQNERCNGETSCAPGEEILNHASVQLNLTNPSSNPGLQKSHAAKARKQSKASRHHINVTNRLFGVVLAFFICYVPFGICVVVPDSDPAVPWTNLLLTINSCLNPIIYAWTMPVFRKVMGCIARCRFEDIPAPVHIIRSCRKS